MSLQKQEFPHSMTIATKIIVICSQLSPLNCYWMSTMVESVAIVVYDRHCHQSSGANTDSHLWNLNVNTTTCWGQIDYNNNTVLME